MTAVVVKSKNRPPLTVNYDDVEYVLPGKIPAELITVRAEYKARAMPLRRRRRRTTARLVSRC